MPRVISALTLKIRVLVLALAVSWPCDLGQVITFLGFSLPVCKRRELNSIALRSGSGRPLWHQKARERWHPITWAWHRQTSQAKTIWYWASDEHGPQAPKTPGLPKDAMVSPIYVYKKNFCNLCWWKILVHSFPSCNVFVQFWYQSNSVFKEWVEKCSLLCDFLKEFV